MPTDWREVQRLIDERTEAERVERNRQTGEAVARALADVAEVPVRRLEQVQGCEPSCPSCRRTNALLHRAWVANVDGTLYEAFKMGYEMARVEPVVCGQPRCSECDPDDPCDGEVYGHE